MFQPPKHSHNQAVHNYKKEIIYIKGIGKIVALQKKLHISVQVYKHISICTDILTYISVYVNFFCLAEVSPLSFM
jgi:hypothetical protein